jgi:hypothetical protein
MVSLIVVCCLATGYSSMPVRLCSSAELASVYGGDCSPNETCESFDPCSGCESDSACKGASNGAGCGEYDGESRWRCKENSGTTCEPAYGTLSVGKKCRCERELCVQKSESASCGSHPHDCDVGSM